MTTEPSIGGCTASRPPTFPVRLFRPVLACVFDIEVLARAAERRAYPESTRLLRTLRSAGLHTAAVSTVGMAAPLLEACGISALVEVTVGGAELSSSPWVAMSLHDVVVAACWRLGLALDDIAVVAGARRLEAELQDEPQAGQWGRFGVIVAVDHNGRFAPSGVKDADLTVADLGELVGR